MVSKIYLKLFQRPMYYTVNQLLYVTLFRDEPGKKTKFLDHASFIYIHVYNKPCSNEQFTAGYICEDNALANLVKISSIISQNQHPSEKASYIGTCILTKFCTMFSKCINIEDIKITLKKIILFPMCNDLVQKLMHYDNKLCSTNVILFQKPLTLTLTVKHT